MVSTKPRRSRLSSADRVLERGRSAGVFVALTAPAEGRTGAGKVLTATFEDHGKVE